MAFQANQPLVDFNFGKNRLAKWLLRLLLLCLVFGGGYAAYRQRVTLPNQQAKTQTQTVSVEKLNLAVTVSANGVIEPERAINLSPKTTGLLKTLLVKEGDRVQKGQILAYMDDSNLTGQLTQAEGQLAERQANLQKLLAGNRREDIAQAQAQLAEAQANLEKLLAGNRPEDIAQGLARLEKTLANLQEADDDFQRKQELATAGAISVKDFNQVRTARDTAEAGVKEAKQALLLLKAGARPEDIAQARARVMQRQQSLKLAQAGARPEDIAQARARVMQAEGAVQNAKAQMADTVIRAPFTGIVARKYADPGAFVSPTTAGSSVLSATSSSILSLASSNQVVTAYVAESNISKIRLGQDVTITVDAYPGKTFTGQVAQIAAQAVIEQNVTSFEVKVAIVSDSEQLLRSGMNVHLEFKVGTLLNALVVPTVAIVRQENATGVFVAGENNKAIFTPIVTGVTANYKTEVKSGLQGTERVFINFPEGFRPQSMTPPPFPGSRSRSR